MAKIISEQKSALIEWFVVASLLATAFVPPLRVPGYVLSIPAAAAPFLLVLCVTQMKQSGLRVWWGLCMVVLMCLAVIVSTFWSYLVLTVPFNGADFSEAYKYAEFIPYVIAFQFCTFERFEKVVGKLMTFGGLVVAMVGIIQVVASRQVGMNISILYGASQAQQDIYLIGQRIYLTGSDPNIAAAIAALFLFYFGIKYYSYRNVISLIFTIIFLYLLLVTQSRTALLAVGISATVYAFIFSNATFLKRMTVLALVIGAGVILVMRLDLSYLTLGFERAREGSNESLNVRFDNLHQAWIWFLESPWFGWGPAKSIHSTIIDSEYALILERYGVLGISIFASYIILHLRMSYRAMVGHAKVSAILSCSALYMVFGVIFMSTNNFFSGYQLMSLIILLLGASRLAVVAHFVERTQQRSAVNY